MAGLLATSTQTSHFWRASVSPLGAWAPPSLVRGVPRTQYRLPSLVSSGGETGPRGMCETQAPGLPSGAWLLGILGTECLIFCNLTEPQACLFIWGKVIDQRQSPCWLLSGHLPSGA